MYRVTKHNECFYRGRSWDRGLKGHAANRAASHLSSRISFASCWKSSFWLRGLPSSPPSAWGIPGCRRLLPQWEHTPLIRAEGWGKASLPWFVWLSRPYHLMGGGRKEQVAAEGGRGVAVLGQPAANRGRGQGQWQPWGCGASCAPIPAPKQCQTQNNAALGADSLAHRGEGSDSQRHCSQNSQLTQHPCPKRVSTWYFPRVRLHNK